MVKNESKEDISQLSVGEALVRLKADPEGAHALTYLDIIDAKINAIFTFIGVLIAAVVYFISQDGNYEIMTVVGIGLNQKYFIFSALMILILAALFALSCIYIIDIGYITRRKKQEGAVIRHILKVARSRRWRYLLALRLTALGTLVAAASVFLSY